MKIVTVKQNSKEWREWRGKGLGASDAPAVMGDSPWTTPFQLWLEKTGLMDRPPANEFQVAAMKRGNELEPIARKMFEERMGKLYPSISAHDTKYEFLRASFDGFNVEENTILEIKCPGKVDHDKAILGKVPTKYKAQVQQQLYISGATKLYYFSWDGKSEIGALVEVLPDLGYYSRLETAMVDFWARVVNRVPPEVTTKEVNTLIMGMQKDLERANKAAAVLQLLTTEEKRKGTK